MERGSLALTRPAQLDLQSGRVLVRDIDSNGNAHRRLPIETSSDSWVRAPGLRQPFELRYSRGVAEDLPTLETSR